MTPETDPLTELLALNSFDRGVLVALEAARNVLAKLPKDTALQVLDNLIVGAKERVES